MADTIEVDLSGPLFDGLAPEIMREFIEETKFDVGQRAFERVHYWLDVNLRNPTPYYETQIIHERAGSDRVVHDRGIIYGPWLEGVSERNRETRFKGYHSFRTAAQETRADVQAIAEATFRREYLPRLNGGT